MSQILTRQYTNVPSAPRESSMVIKPSYHQAKFFAWVAVGIFIISFGVEWLNPFVAFGFIFVAYGAGGAITYALQLRAHNLSILNAGEYETVETLAENGIAAANRIGGMIEGENKTVVLPGWINPEQREALERFVSDGNRAMSARALERYGFAQKDAPEINWLKLWIIKMDLGHRANNGAVIINKRGVDTLSPTPTNGSVKSDRLPDRQTDNNEV